MTTVWVVRQLIQHRMHSVLTLTMPGHELQRLRQLTGIYRAAARTRSSQSSPPSGLRMGFPGTAVPPSFTCFKS